uniref:Ulp1 protease family, C-terminal catalytic domain containing protein n=1 Tax=Solanum tuberosum TaxID=4113 RepID=M1DKM0_SOLTU
MMKKDCDDKELTRKVEKLSQEFILLKEYVNKNLSISSPSNNIIHEVHIKGVDGDEDGNAGIDLSYSKGKMKNEFCSVEKVACENVIDSSDALDLIKGRVHNEMLSENNSNQDIKIPHLFSVTGIYMNKKGVDFQHPLYSNAAILKSLEVRFVGGLPIQSDLDYDIYVSAFAEYFIRKKQISSDFDENQYRSRLACLLWDYGLTKKNQQAESDSKKKIIQKRQKL